jgi:hypothetical protein
MLEVIKRAIPFILTFVLGLFIASFFITISFPKVRVNQNCGARWRHKAEMRRQIEALKSENDSLKREIENSRIENDSKLWDAPIMPVAPVAPLPPDIEFDPQSPLSKKDFVKPGNDSKEKVKPFTFENVPPSKNK